LICLILAAWLLNRQKAPGKKLTRGGERTIEIVDDGARSIEEDPLDFNVSDEELLESLLDEGFKSDEEESKDY